MHDSFVSLLALSALSLIDAKILLTNLDVGGSLDLCSSNSDESYVFEKFLPMLVHTNFFCSVSFSIAC